MSLSLFSAEGVACLCLRSGAPPVRSRFFGGWSRLRTASFGVGVSLCLSWRSGSFPVTKTCFSEHGGACCAVKRLVGLVSFRLCLVVNEAACGAEVALALDPASVCSRHPSDLCGDGVVACSVVLLLFNNRIGFVSSGGLSVFRSVFFVRVAVRWMYTVSVECNGDGNLWRKPLNDGIVGPRLLLVPPVVSFYVPSIGA
ncbi:hypothetical protein F2Q69_00045099 [Brassica cretica]|uniref:Uncharacterized protein n=1 Tax=Brassica cretica TaxID=69181 RepID=A0A8S9NMU6_BRACR|nr:hypothetical protein F2Q69_00045099 [Brassica cretica]